MKAPKWAAWVAVAVCLPVISLPWLIAVIILTHLAMWVLVNPMYLSTLLR